jgi:hypothetical protein
MKKNFTNREFFESAGCWITKRNSDLLRLIESISKNNSINFKDVLTSPLIPTQDKKWWLFNSCNLTLQEKQILALESAKLVAHIYNKKYPNDKRISLCINITARYLKGLVSLDVLIKYKKDAYVAAYAAYAADAYAVDAYAADAAYAAARAADAAYAADAAHAAYAVHAYAADAARAAHAAYAADAYVAYVAYAEKKLIKSWIKTLNTF